MHRNESLKLKLNIFYPWRLDLNFYCGVFINSMRAKNVRLQELQTSDILESRKRGLQMRTYTVVPTNETNGLIEWVSNLKGMR